MDLYIKKIKELEDKLANVATIVEDEDLVIYALNGLPREYNAFRTSMRTRSQPVSFSELHILLKSEESAIEKQTKRENISIQPITMFANQNTNSRTPGNAPQLNHQQNNYRGRGRGWSNFNQGRGRAQSDFGNRPFIQCQVCNRPSHSALDCYNRMNYNYQGEHPPHGCPTKLLVILHLIATTKWTTTIKESTPSWLPTKLTVP